MRLRLVLAQRQDRGVPAVSLQPTGIIERDSGVVTEFGTWNAVRLVLVIQGRPVPGDVALGVDGTGDGQRERQPDRCQSKRRLRR